MPRYATDRPIPRSQLDSLLAPGPAEAESTARSARTRLTACLATIRDPDESRAILAAVDSLARLEALLASRRRP